MNPGAELTPNAVHLPIPLGVGCRDRANQR